ncbi:MAG TPA: methyltransferase [Roseiflexaceae bacterium]|nr:methyltransferase [Roseiflexaceae bacterium]HMP41280.1 methyltransferase [Roseiflexaceae bacterium]
MEEYTRHFRHVQLGNQAIEIEQRPEFSQWAEVSWAARLLFDAIATHNSVARAVVWGCGNGALAVALAPYATHIDAYDTHLVALELTRRAVARNHARQIVVHDTISALPESARMIDLVACEAPPNRQLARRLLVEAHELLRPQGRLYLAGANHAGIQPIIRDAHELFGNLTPLAIRQRHRSVLFERTAPQALPDWAMASGIAPGSQLRFTVQVGGESFDIHSLPGVFAHDHLDSGSALLIEALATLDRIRDSRVVDIGCGYGIIGLVAAKRGAAWVDLLDVNLLAVAAATATLKANGVTQAAVLASDGLQAVSDRRYDLALMNPPFHSGKAIDYELPRRFITQAHEALQPGGRLMLVANSFLRYERLMRELFAEVSCLAENRSYQVWLGRKQ